MSLDYRSFKNYGSLNSSLITINYDNVNIKKPKYRINGIAYSLA